MKTKYVILAGTILISLSTFAQKDELKALKNSSKYKDALEIGNVKKIAFKTTWKEEASKETVTLEDDFVECLQTLVLREDDPYLSSLYEHLMYGSEDKSDKDVFFFSSDE